MPWQAIADAGEPVNALTGNGYRGSNHLVLGMVAASRGWSRHWATYKQMPDDEDGTRRAIDDIFAAPLQTSCAPNAPQVGHL